MVFFRFLCFSTLATFSLAPSLLYAQAWASKMFTATHHDFGTVSRNAKTEFLFEIENVYEEDLHIASVRSSCGCTSARILKQNLKTWEKGGIVAELNTKSFIGPKTASLTVVIDRPYYAEVQLLVMGHIRSDIVTEPGQIDFGNVDCGEQKSQVFKVSYAGRPNWEITDVRGNNKNLQVRIQKREAKGNLVTYLMELKLLDSAAPGSVQDELVIVTNDSVNQSFTLPVSARISSAVEIAPAVVDLGRLAASEPAMQRFVVKGKEPFEIKDIRASDSRIKFAHDEGKKLVHVVSVQALTNAGTQKDIDCDVEVISDLTVGSTTTCKIVGHMDWDQ